MDSDRDIKIQALFSLSHNESASSTNMCYVYFWTA